MMLTITPTRLSGAVTPPPSKSMSHRLILAAALAKGESIVENIALSEDIRATLRCVEALGASWSLQGSALRVTGLKNTFAAAHELPCFDCGESGSTLRFLIPIALAVSGGGIFTGHGRLMERPLAPYLDIFREKGIFFAGKNHVLTIQGQLTPGEYRLPGNVSSQFFTGLLYALALLDAPSTLIPTTRLEGIGYINMTIRALEQFGVPIAASRSIPPQYLISPGGQYQAQTVSTEADWSQAAFWYAAGGLGNDITVKGMNEESLQGDRVIVQHRELFACEPPTGHAVSIDASHCPDLVPPLAVWGAFMNGSLYLKNIGRLRIKESDRLSTITQTLSALGADITGSPDSLTIHGKKSLAGGVTVNCHGDHRIAMMLAIAATRCVKPITLTGAQCVHKSYPTFWEDYQALGGIIHEHIGE